MKRKRLLSFDLGGNTYYVEFDGGRVPIPPGVDASNRRLFVEVSEEEFAAAGERDKRTPADAQRRTGRSPRPLRASVTPGPSTGRWTLLLEPQVREAYNAPTLAALCSTCENLAARVAAHLEARFPGRQVYVYKVGDAGTMVITEGESNPFVGIDETVDISTFAEWM
jgi:hypothetical protein